jgi:hypothetical protein
MEVKDSELSKKAYAEKYNYTIQHVNNLIRNNQVKWRYLFPETEEYVLIDTDYVMTKTLSYKLDKINKNP